MCQDGDCTMRSSAGNLTSEVSLRKADLLDEEMRERRVKRGVQPRMRLSEDALGINNREDPGHAGGLQAPAVLGAVGECC